MSSIPSLHEVEACSQPHAEMVRFMLIEQDMERAKLRAIIAELEQIIVEAGLTPFKTSGESARDGYIQRGEAIRAVMRYFNCDGYTFGDLPEELRESIRPLMVT